MAIDTKPVQFKHSTTLGSPALAFLRQHPLWGYFLLAFSLSWLWEFPAFMGHTAVLRPWEIPLAVLLSPISAGLIMAWITEDRAGMGRLLLRCLLWRAGVQWYLVVLLFIPVILFLGILVMPGAIAAFRVPSASFFLTYLLSFVLVLVTAPLGEEPGWRGFALPRLQARYGPLLGTLILGSLWVLWHLPYWLFVPGWAGFGTGLLGFGVPFVKWAALIVAVTIVMTWVYNLSHGSVLLAILFHASMNTTVAPAVPAAFFPMLLPPAIPIFFMIGSVLVAILIIVATRGRLGYDQYRRETGLAASDSRIQ